MIRTCLKRSAPGLLALGVLTLSTGLPAPRAGADDKKARTDAHGDPLPAGALARLGTLRWRHGDTATFVAFMPDGKSVLSAGQDRTARLWDLATGKELRRFGPLTADPRLRGPSRAGVQVALSADGKVLVLCDQVGTMAAWDTATGKELHSSRGAVTQLNALALSPDGKALATLGYDGAIGLREVATGKEVRTLNKDDPGGGRAGRVIISGYSGLAFAPDGKTLASSGLHVDNGNITGMVHLWDLATGKSRWQITRPQQRWLVAAPTFSPDGSLLAFAEMSGGVILADAATGKEVRQLKSTSPRMNSLVFSADGKTLHGKGMMESAVASWEVATGKEGPTIGQPGGQFLAVRRYYMTSGRQLDLSRDGKLLAMVGEDNAVRIIDLKTGKDRQAHGGHRGLVTSLTWSRDGKGLVSLGEEGSAVVWDSATGKETGRVPVPDSPTGFLLSPDGKALVAEGRDGIVRLYDAATGKERHRLGGDIRTRLSTFTFAPDGKTLAVRARTSPGVVLYDVETGKQRLAVGSQPAPAEVGFARALVQVSPLMAFSPDGRLLAASNAENAVVLWDAATGRELRRLPLTEGRVPRNGAFTPDGRALVIDVGDRAVVWEVATGRERRTCAGPAKAAEPGVPGAWRITYSYLYPTSGTCPVAVSPDGRTLAIAHEQEDRVRVWDLASGVERGVLAGHNGDVTTLAFAPGGKTLATGSADSTTLIWDLSALPAAKARPRELTARDLGTRWEALGSDDAARGFEAICTLADAPELAVGLLKERLKAAPPVDGVRVEKLIADLDGRRFASRQKAFDELAKLGPLAGPALRKALAGKPSVEAAKRMQDLLDRAVGLSLSLEQLRLLRGIEVLERLGTPGAKQVLRALAEGAPGALETVEARASLDRLGR